MSAIKQLRVTLADDLTETGVPTSAAWPTDINPPCIYVIPPLGNEYVTAGPGFGEYTVAVDVVILTDHGDAEESLDTLEDLLEAAIVNSMDWKLVGVEPPEPLTVTDSGAEYLGIVMHLSKSIHLLS